MKKLLLLIITILSINVSVYAQSGGKVIGTILDDKNQELSFSNVILLNYSDSTIFKAALADEHGSFAIENIPNGNYLLSASMVGYVKFISPKITISENNSTLDLKNILLQTNTQVLEGVNVVARKPLLEQMADKLVMNVENSIISAGSTVFEVLQRAPGVSIDQNDNISLKGKQGVQVYMDGKPTYMSQEQLANLLKNMNSDQIVKIEIISNPSSKYDAAGNSGILNIITKKNAIYGTNGSLSIGAGLSIPPQMGVVEVDELKPKYNVTLNLNNRKGKFNTFGNLSLRSGKNYGLNEINRILDNRILDQYFFSNTESKNLSLRAGSDYFLSKNTTIGVLVNANIGDWGTSRPSVNDTKIFDNNELQSSLFTTSNPKNEWKNITYNTNFKHAFNKSGKELTFDLDYSTYDNLTRERGMHTTFYNNDRKPIGEELLVTSDIPNKYNIMAAKMDFTLPFADTKSKLEMGLKSSFVKSNNNIQVFNNGDKDLGRSNHFLYKEIINAAYTNYSNKLSDKWSIQGGLRLENTNSKGESLTLKEVRSRNYLNLFPSLFLTHVASEKHSFNFNYSRRIDRPEYKSLNPFIFFLDPYTYELGNEKLRSQFTDAVELSHTYKQSFLTSIGYSFTNDFSSQILKNAINEPEILEMLQKYNPNSEIDPDNISFATRENVGTYQNYNITFSFPVNVSKWWTMNNNLTGYHSIYKGELLGERLNAKVIAYNFYTSQNFIIKNGWTGEASMWYNSANTEAMFTGKAIYAINAGIAKSFWGKKATFKLAANDIFATAKWSGRTDFAGVKMTLNNRWDNRAVRVSLVYNFGNQKVKSARNRQTATTSEQQRVGSSSN